MQKKQFGMKIVVLLVYIYYDARLSVSRCVDAQCLTRNSEDRITVFFFAFTAETRESVNGLNASRVVNSIPPQVRGKNSESD